MAETTADVRRDIELTRERMSSTLAELERKLDVAQIIRDHPWPALAVAVGAGVLLSGSRADVKAAAATVTATRGASNKLAGALDVMVATLVGGVHSAVDARVNAWADELKIAIGAERPGRTAPRATQGFGVGPINDIEVPGTSGNGGAPRGD